MSKLTILTEEYRGSTLENLHLGRIAVVNDKFETILSYGDTKQKTYYRSASKPIQAMAAIAEGVVDSFNDEEIAMLAGSHVGEDYHIKNIESMLKKGNLTEEQLIMLPAYPQIASDKDKMIREGIPPRKAIHNCSAKHIALMLLSKKLTGDVVGYEKVDNKAEQRVIEVISFMSEVEKDEIEIGIDGCGVPVFAVPLDGIAKGFLKLACPDLIEDITLKNAAIKMDKAMHLHPLSVRGTGYICTMINTDSNIVAKGGAMGVYGFALKKERLGISFKMDDGTEQSWGVVLAEILRQLNYDNKDTIDMLEKLGNKYTINDNKTIVGEMKAVFKLK